MDAYLQWLASPPGRLRRALVEGLLSRHLPPPPVRVLDVGGGNGVVGRWLAAQGHEVTVVEPDPMLAGLAAEAGLRVVAGDVHALPPGTFDLVICHFVLEYVERSPDAVAALAAAVAPGGALSVITLNRAQEPLRQALRHRDYAAAVAAIGQAAPIPSLLGHDRRPLAAAALRAALTAAGLAVVAQEGLFVAADYLSEPELNASFADVVRFELSAGADPILGSIGRYLHLWAQQGQEISPVSA